MRREPELPDMTVLMIMQSTNKLLTPFISEFFNTEDANHLAAFIKRRHRYTRLLEEVLIMLENEKDPEGKLVCMPDFLSMIEPINCVLSELQLIHEKYAQEDN